MATADEILATMSEETTQSVIVINSDLRTINIPESIKILGVESDDDVLRLHFRMPKMYGEVDLSEFAIRINYMNAKEKGDVYAVSDAAVDGEYITFSWLVGRTATEYRGNVQFIVCLKRSENGVVMQEYNTTVATLKVLEGLETGEAIVARYPDIIESMLLRLDALEKGGSTGGGSNIDDTTPSATTTYSSSKIDELLNEQKEADAKQDERLTALEQNVPSGTGGLTTAQVNALDGMFNVVAYDGDKDYAAAYQAFKSAFGIVTMYTIKNNLTNVTSDNDVESITGGSAYTATLTVTDGYTMSAVFVYMGGTDITSTAYSNGVINIESVTGDIVISATATVAGVTTYTITNNLTNATSSNPAVSIEDGQAYSATITPDEGYTLTGGTVSVTMGGADITASAYADGVITIAGVTGDVVITVMAVAVESGDDGELVLLKSITGDGASWVDTEFILEDSTHTMELSAKLAGADSTTLMGADGHNVDTPYGKTAVWTNGLRYLSGSLNQGSFSNVGTWNSNKASLASIQFYLVLADGSQIIYEDAEHTSQYGDKTSTKYGTSREFVPIPLYLFTANATSNANLKYTPSDCTIYFFKITDADGNVVLNLVPAKQGNKIGMYDTVNKKFHENKGTGVFSYEEVSA